LKTEIKFYYYLFSPSLLDYVHFAIRNVSFGCSSFARGRQWLPVSCVQHASFAIRSYLVLSGRNRSC